MRRQTYITWRRNLGYFLLFALLVGLLYAYVRTPILTITAYEVIGLPEKNQAEVDVALRGIDQKPFLKFIPANKLFTYRKNESKQRIVELFPETKEVLFQAVLPSTLRVTVHTHTPLFRIDETHVLSSEGAVYQNLSEELPTVSFASSTITQKELGGIQMSYLTVDATPVESLSQALDNLTFLIPKINAVLFPVSSIVIETTGDVTFYSATGQQVKISLQMDSRRVWSNIVSAIDTEPLKGLLEKKKDSFEYIDGRFGNKMFYKFTTTPIPTIITATTTEVYDTSTTTPVIQ